MIKEQDIDRFRELRTPFYFYDLHHLRNVAGRAKEAAGQYGFHVHYAIKANAQPKILKVLKSLGFGIDCVSGQELAASLACGFSPGKIAFAGVGKSDEELGRAIEKDIFSINVESIEELQVLAQLAAASGKKPKVALRINPDVAAKTHHYITTGLEENKFGIPQWQLPELVEVLNASPVKGSVEVTGLHYHIGSQIRDLGTFKNLCGRMLEIQQWFNDRGFYFSHLNAGGGLGIDYSQPDGADNPDFEEFFGIFHKFLPLQANQELHFELGRAIVATCGDLISRVLFVKKGAKTQFLILDAGMTELIRPALYQAFHPIKNLTTTSTETAKYDVVGPVCESSDCFGKAMELPVSQRGDLVAIRCAGAYGEVMASNYNLRELNPPDFGG